MALGNSTFHCMYSETIGSLVNLTLYRRQYLLISILTSPRQISSLVRWDWKGIWLEFGTLFKFVDHLQKSVFSKWFHNYENVLCHAVQDDHYSCGIIALNMLAHAILDKPLWSNMQFGNELNGLISWHYLHPSESSPMQLQKSVPSIK